jgi:hypothetical protein
MPSITGSFSGRITNQSGMPLTDQSHHEIGIAEVQGTQQSADELWNNSKITYWGVNDLVDGQGSQRGYYNNVHPDGGRDFGTFEARVSSGGKIVEGSFTITGGDGQYRGITGSGTFKTVMKSETELEANWQGSYELAKTQTA